MAVKGVVKAAESIKSLTKGFISYGQKIPIKLYTVTFRVRTGYGWPPVLHMSQDNISPELFNVAQQ